MNALVDRFMSSAFFAEADAGPVVARMIDRTTDPDERRRLVAYAAEEEGHAALLDEFLTRRQITRGEPFAIQRFFHLARSRATLLLQAYHVEILAGVFYGAVANEVEDPETKALLRRILRDEAGHVRLFRDLCARELASLGPLARLKARGLAAVFRVGAVWTAKLQARQLAPLLGEEVAAALPGKVDRLVRRHLAEAFARPLASDAIAAAPSSPGPRPACPSGTPWPRGCAA